MVGITPGELMAATVAILVAMVSGFFGVYRRLGEVGTDVRILRERDDDHGRKLDDHEKRIRELEERIRTSRDRGTQ